MKPIDKIPKNNPFRVPEGYFDDVQQRILSATESVNREKPKTKALHRLRPYLMAAASIAGLVLLSYTLFIMIRPDRGNTGKQDILAEESLSQYVYDLDVYPLEENDNQSIAKQRIPDINKNDIIDYLILNNIDINDIYQQL
jgi:hypothetical protein